MTPVLRIDGLKKRFGSLAVSDSISLEIHPGELHAVIGPNGAGKSVLLGQISGLIEPDSGTTEFDGRDVTNEPAHRRALLGLSRTFQIASYFPTLEARENVAVAVQARSGSSFEFFRPVDDELKIAGPSHKLLERTELSARADVIAAELAHGEHRQLELAMALSGTPRLLLLDEPMAGLGADDSALIVNLLRPIKGRHAVLLVEHDMDAVFELADRISVLVYGRVIATGTPDQIRDDPAVREAYLGADDD